MMAYFSSIALTCVLSFEDNDYNQKIELQMRVADPTFRSQERGGPRHPLIPLLRGNVFTLSCPPCSMSTTSFEMGAGVSIVPGGSAISFRVLLQLTDNPTSAERPNDNSPAVRVTRKVKCSIADASDSKVYNLSQLGPMLVTMQLLVPQKGEMIHAMVAWRSDDFLTLLSFSRILDDVKDEFRTFFKTEVGAFADSVDSTGTSTSVIDSELTPIRRIQAAELLSSTICSPEPWSKRTRLV
jgi:hypothetical protein